MEYEFRQFRVQGCDLIVLGSEFLLRVVALDLLSSWHRKHPKPETSQVLTTWEPNVPMLETLQRRLMELGNFFTIGPLHKIRNS